MAGSFPYASSFRIRSYVVIAAFVVAFVVPMARACASVEFCSALLGNMNPIGASLGTSARSYSYELTAVAPRAVDAQLVADTNAGWFGWSISGVPLERTTRLLRFPAANVAPYGVTLPAATIPYPAIASSPLSVVFPYDVIVRHAWVEEANRADAAASTDYTAAARCDVPDFATASMADTPPYPGASATPTPLPSPNAPGTRAVPTLAPFAPARCSTPFKEATVTRPARPELPTMVESEGLGGTSIVEVAVGKDGKLIDAWTLGSSGSRAMDLSALRAARSSQYSGAVSYCRPVNGLYLFRADFWPG